MALADYSAYKTAVAANSGNFPFTKQFTNSTGTSLRLVSSWIDPPNAGATPSTAAACNAGTTGALVTQPRLTATTNPLYLAGADVGSGYPFGATTVVVDRLSHQGGLSGVPTTAQTTNLPTAALTRYTSGVGVMAAIEIHSAIGSTATTVTASYTNQDGTAGRTTKPVAIGGSGLNVARLLLPLPLQDGDTGVRSVESVTLAANTTSAGNLGVTLFKPLLLMPGHSLNGGHQPNHWDGLLCGGQKLVGVDDDACLQLLTYPGDAGNTVQFAGALTIVEVA
jgi:hypothetical protein